MSVISHNNSNNLNTLIDLNRRRFKYKHYRVDNMTNKLLNNN